MNLKHDKEKILLAGESLFRSQGYHATGINEILKQSGVSKGSFYHYFKSKEDFALQVIELYGGETANMIQKGLSEPQESYIDRIRNFAQVMMAFQQSEDCANGCLVYNLSFELAGRNESIASSLQIQLDRWIDQIEPFVKAGQEAGEIIDRYPARDLAMMIHTALNGASGRMKMSQSIQPLQQMLDMTLDLIKA